MTGKRNILMPLTPCYVKAAASIRPESGEMCGDNARMAQLPDYKQIIPDANLRRRMGRLLKMAVGCGLKALDGVPSEEVAGIITSTGLGFMRDTVDFDNMLIDRNEELLNPSPFMQSTFNTASGYIAMLRKIRSYNTVYVHRDGGFVAALADAFMLLGEGRGVLVGGFDEVTDEVDEVRRRLGCWKRGGDSGQCRDRVRGGGGERRDDGGPERCMSPSRQSGVNEQCDNGFMPLGEGAGFMYLSTEKSNVRIAGVSPFGGQEVDVQKTARVVNCSSYVDAVGVSFSILPIVLSMVCRMEFHGLVLVRDDVNRSGAAVLLDFS